VLHLHPSDLCGTFDIVMADVKDTPQLKRKREGAEPRRKKVKTQRKIKSEEDTEGDLESPLRASIATSPSSKTNGKPTFLPNPKKDPTPLADSTALKAHADKKKGRRPKQEEVKMQEKVESPVGQSTPTVVAVNGAHVDRSSKKDKKQKRQRDKLSDRWSISASQGGWFLPRDPVFSPDDKYLLLAKSKTLEVYATDTSLLARELSVGITGVILSYAISSVRPTLVYIADSTGMITLWDWTNGTKIGRWDIGANVRYLDVVKQPDSDQDLLYAHETDNSHIINVHALRTGTQASKTELKRILKRNKPITGIQVLLQGRIVVASSANSIMIGKRTKLHKTAIQEFDYIWREFETSSRITTFHAYVHMLDTDKSKKMQPDPRDHLDLAIGNNEGTVYLFEDILSSFTTIENNQKGKLGKIVGLESLRPKRLHWHREAVGSVKWSLDGV
jgi:NET1-associated nuclear protein 1 (U3 small nucleolar RNA-associated protein 17)